ncbi:MAG: hypothetical protein LBT21_00410 [Oscillospiraceae bacterium]|jgi:V/A-type H+-transporting ATPase subunit E|nr:hypothetical protein [Oscillospiraceae bacterium]
MSGIERILSQIEQDGAARCAQIDADAHASAQALSADADEQCAALRARAEPALRAARKKAAEAAESAAQAQCKRLLLQAKNRALDEALSVACAALEALEPDEYFAAVLRLAVKWALPGDGELLLSQADAARLPDGFADAVNNQLVDSGSLRISASGRITEQGFVLVYGDIEINCLFSALLEEQQDTLRELLAELLFAREG